MPPVRLLTPVALPTVAPSACPPATTHRRYCRHRACYTPGLLEGFLYGTTGSLTVDGTRVANFRKLGVKLNRMLQNNTVTAGLTGHTDNDTWIYTGYVGTTTASSPSRKTR